MIQAKGKLLIVRELELHPAQLLPHPDLLGFVKRFLCTPSPEQG